MGHTVAVVVSDGVNPFEAAVACEVFGLDRPELGVPWYRFLVCAPQRRVATTGGFAMDVPHGLDAAAAADTVIVPAAPVERRTMEPAVLEALQVAHARGARMVSFCSGAFTLAEAGLLDGRRATTHWLYTGQFRVRFPRVRLDPDVLFVDDGDVLTSAGTAAGIDLALHLVRLDHGAEIANAVARRMVVPPHRDGGQAQFVQAPHVPRTSDDGAIPRLLDELRGELDADLDVAQMASRALMSPRTFARRFREVTGTTPARWLARQRIEYAQQLLESTELDIELVAARSGLGSGATLRDRFRRELGTTPTAYRRTFRRRHAA